MLSDWWDESRGDPEGTSGREATSSFHTLAEHRAEARAQEALQAPALLHQRPCCESLGLRLPTVQQEEARSSAPPGREAWLALSSCVTLSKSLNISESQSHLKT